MNTGELDFIHLLSSNKQELDRIILEYLPENHDNREISSLYTMMRDYPSRGGKGLRGTLCLLWSELFGGKRENALITAAALELFQNWILIHDDIEDESDLRRGLPALHKKHGVELAINAGDALHGKMWGLLLQNERIIGAHSTVRVLSEFSKMIDETTQGQQMELYWTRNAKWEISEGDYLLMVTKKTAWYTCITPARLGIIISQAGVSGTAPTFDNELLDAVIDFGTNLGISFQIIDDLLNLTADEVKYGKEILGDIFEGKRTLMLIHLLSNSSSNEKKKIVELMSRPRADKTKKEVEYVYSLMKGTDSLEYARNLAKHHSEIAMRKFEEIVIKEGIEKTPTYSLTKAILEYLTTRDY